MALRTEKLLGQSGSVVHVPAPERFRLQVFEGGTFPLQFGFMRKLIAFDDDTFAKLTQLGRDRMGTLQELADEAFGDLLKKHGVPVDLTDALKKSTRKSPVSDNVRTPRQHRRNPTRRSPAR